eukprot:234353-Hanusia_phi.AAC.1
MRREGRRRSRQPENSSYLSCHVSRIAIARDPVHFGEDDELGQMHRTSGSPLQTPETITPVYPALCSCFV